MVFVPSPPTSENYYTSKFLQTVQGELNSRPDRSGWARVDETASYVSSTVINVPANSAIKFAKGWKVRLKQNSGAYKYFFITSITDTDSVSTLTLFAGTSYSIANEPIKDLWVASGVDPMGFPNFFDYAPTLVAQDTLVINTVVVTRAKFYIRDGWVDTWVEATFNVATPGVTIQSQLPVASVSITSYPGAGITNNGTTAGVARTYLASTTTFNVQLYNAGNWAAFSSSFGVNFHYPLG